jgi:hypothetical protein
MVTVRGVDNNNKYDHNKNNSKNNNNLLYKDESVCVCTCVCPAACRRTHTSFHPKTWRGLLISPGLGTKPGGDPKCRPQGYPS